MIRTVVHSSAARAARAAANLLAEALRAKPDLVLGLPTGQTTVPFYRALVDLHAAGRLDLRRATTFNLDELVGLAPSDRRSYRAFMERHLFSRVNLRPSHTHVLNGAARDWRAEAARFERELARAGGLDVAIVGVGVNGHVAFNEPARSLHVGTHRARLHPATRRANAALFGGRWRDVPEYALTMGMGAVLGAREIVLLATGREKAAIVRHALDGRITTAVPASLLQAHPRVVAVLDRAAASKLR